MNWKSLFCKHNWQVIEATKFNENFIESWCGKTIKQYKRIRINANLKCDKCGKVIKINQFRNILPLKIRESIAMYFAKKIETEL